VADISAITPDTTGKMRNVTGAASNVNICGLCGQPLDGGHSQEEEHLGIQTEYKIFKIRGALADSVAVLDPNDKYPLPTRALATNLGVDAGSLLGFHYTCLVSRDPYGTARSDYRLVEASYSSDATSGSA
jgi:hypothetical protein